jgi:large subunit ribosomal protein L4
MAVQTYTKSGAKATTPAKLDKAVFAVMPKNYELIKLAYDAYLANGRDNLAITKTRGLVRGGGKKPWRQKGTGRARFGSSRNPIWRGGGIVFGPTGEENYAKKIHVNAKRQALRQALSLAANEDRIKIVEGIQSKDGKTASLAAFLSKVGAAGNVLIVLESKDDMLERAARNLPRVKTVQANYLNVHDVLNGDTLLVAQDSLKPINEWLTPSKKTPSAKTAEEKPIPKRGKK